MRIGILTLPLNTNYGGILQAYALQTVLQRMGHEVMLIESDRFPSCVPKRFAYSRRCLVYPKRFVCKYLLGKNIDVRPDLEIIKEYNLKAQNILPFIKRNFKYVPLESIIKPGRQILDCVIVGSDQVWRRDFVRESIVDYFLKWLGDNKTIKRIAYAASFGSEKWEFTPEETRNCSDLSKKFSIITVREKQGVELCRKYLNAKAYHVLDPTMLLDYSDYTDLINSEEKIKTEGTLFYYILDRNETKTEFINMIASKFELLPFSIMPKQHKMIETQCEKNIYNSIATWLSCFKQAEFVVTDSFHGCVFSILFNKPFYVIGNYERGIARFNSLLKMFGLENRMIDVNSCIELNIELLDNKIDWEKVNCILEQERENSKSYIISNLAGNR